MSKQYVLESVLLFISEYDYMIFFFSTQSVFYASVCSESEVMGLKG